MIEAIRNLMTRRSDTNKVTAHDAPDLSSLLNAGVNAQPVQAAVAQIVQEPQIAAVTPEVVVMPEPLVVETAEPAEDEAAWNRRVRIENGMSAEQRVAS